LIVLFVIPSTSFIAALVLVRHNLAAALFSSLFINKATIRNEQLHIDTISSIRRFPIAGLCVRRSVVGNIVDSQQRQLVINHR
jgi:hypothetical protein